MEAERLKIQTDDKGFYWIDMLTDDGGYTFCNVGNDQEAKVRAEQIYIACNSHDKLLDACKEVLPEILCTCEPDNINATCSGACTYSRIVNAITEAEKG